MTDSRFPFAQLNRRRFLKSLAATAGSIAVPAALTACIGDDSDSNGPNLSQVNFENGVASGDPLSDSVIIWTRATPSNESDTEVTLGYEMATDAEMTSLVASGTVTTHSDRDFTIKIDVTELAAGTTYYYRFRGADEVYSATGTTKTLPEGSVEQVTLAMCSCSNYPAGYFNVYQEIANSNADAVVHLGDYIYEYETNNYPDAESQIRAPSPLTEIISLDDYRERYRQYRTDSQLQAAHAAKAFICVWDDHEVANDTYVNGAENHDETTEGNFSERQAAALQAYHEWLPIRTGADNSHIYRSFDFGNLIRLHMLDTRILARSIQLDYNDYITLIDGEVGLDVAAFTTAMTDASRTLLGSEQSTWFGESITTSNAKWDLLGQQVLMGRMHIPQELLLLLGQLQGDLTDEQRAAIQAQLNALLGELATIKQRILLGDTTVTTEEANRVNSVAPYNLDAWDGYEIARQSLFSQVAAAASSRTVNLISLAGDTHNAWASHLYPLDLTTFEVDRTTSMGVEFATPSVTSPGLEDYSGFGDDAVAQAQFEGVIGLLIDDLQYLNAANRGFALMTFTQTTATCDWVFVDTITSTSYTAAIGKRMQVTADTGNLQLENIELG